MPVIAQLGLPLPPADAGGARGKVRIARLNGGPLRYRLSRTARRTVGIYVGGGEVNVRAPRWVSVADIEAFLLEKESWVAKRLKERTAPPAAFHWREGEALPVLGRGLRLCAREGMEGVRREGDTLLLPASEVYRWRALTLEWLKNTALERFCQRSDHYASLLGVQPPSVGLSNARTRWGSCWRARGTAGRILLHWRLIHLPPLLLDYVVAHEIAHLREPNHSKRFWAVVGALFPAYAAARRSLKLEGAALPVL